MHLGQIKSLNVKGLLPNGTNSSDGLAQLVLQSHSFRFMPLPPFFQPLSWHDVLSMSLSITIGFSYPKLTYSVKDRLGPCHKVNSLSISHVKVVVMWCSLMLQSSVFTRAIHTLATLHHYCAPPVIPIHSIESPAWSRNASFCRLKLIY